MNNKQKRFFKIAREVSLMSDFKRTKIGTVVVEKNRIISTGFNSNKTSRVQKEYDRFRDIDDLTKYQPKVHAEVAALAPLINHPNINWKHVSIYIYRELKDGTVSCSKPCPACMKLIRELGIKKIYYTEWDGSFVKEEYL